MDTKQQLTIENIKKILRHKRTDFLKKDEFKRTLSSPQSLEKVEEDKISIEELKHLMAESVRTNTLTGMNFTANSLLKKFGIEIDPSSDNYKILCRELLRLSIKLVKNTVERNNGDYSSAPGLLEEALEEKSIEITKIKEASEVLDDIQPVLMTQVIKEYINEQSHTVTEKTLLEYKSALNLIVEIVGDIPMDQLSHSELRKYKSTLQKLPPNKNKIKKYRDLTIQQIIDLELKKTLSIQTVNKNIIRASQLLDWAKRQGYVKDNYANGLQIKNKKSDQDQRKEFSADDLENIFNPSRYLERTAEKNYQYWCPIIAQLSGARLNEIAQLYISDIKQVKGTWVFDINKNTPDKRLKNKAAKRLIPIHADIIGLGFLNYVEELKKKKEVRVFPELKHSRDGYGKSLSRWFSDFRKAIGINDPQKVFHSFRHTFINKLKQELVDSICLAEVVGHSLKGETLARYGKRFTPDVLKKEVISKLEFNVLDWNKLKK